MARAVAWRFPPSGSIYCTRVTAASCQAFTPGDGPESEFGPCVACCSQGASTQHQALTLGKATQWLVETSSVLPLLPGATDKMKAKNAQAGGGC